ncbi:MAG TPA: glycosyltransferase family 9 protein [Acetobacteraceae bacterium]|nr:glycosyltransferase family 9 protein [Acetobacteraceae bacterium]
MLIDPDPTAVIQPLPGIGDMVWHLPHIRALAARWGGPVTLVAKPRSAADQLFAAETTVAKILWMDRNPDNRPGRHDGPAGVMRLIAALRAHRFRRAVLLHHSHTLAFALMSAGIPERYGYGFGLQRLFLNRPPALPAAALALHPYDQATAWLNIAGIPMPNPEPRLPVTASARRAVLDRLGPASGGLVLLGIGTSEPAKQWGATRFTELAIALAAAGWRRFALAGGVAEAVMSEQIRAHVSTLAEVVPAIAWSLPEVAALAAEARFYIGNDTGAMNLAAAVGIRAYGLFGAVAPFHHASRIIPILPPDGQVSLQDGMARITPATVLAAIRNDRGTLAPLGGSDALA